MKPKIPSSALNVPVLLPKDCGNNAKSMSVAQKKLYQCRSYVSDDPISSSHFSRRSYLSDDPQAVCPSCKGHMSRALYYVVPAPTSAAAGGGFVKGLVTYMVMDNLVVSPMSTISAITYLNKCGIKGIDTLEERVVELGMDEGLKLLKESLQSKAVLTSVFLKN